MQWLGSVQQQTATRRSIERVTVCVALGGIWWLFRRLLLCWWSCDIMCCRVAMVLVERRPPACVSAVNIVVEICLLMLGWAMMGRVEGRSQWKGRGLPAYLQFAHRTSVSRGILARHSPHHLPPQMELPGFPRSFPRVPRSDKHFPYRSQFAKDNMCKGDIGISSHIVKLQHDEQDCRVRR